MSLLQTIKDDQLVARKNKGPSEKISLLTTLIGEASMPGKNDGNRESTDAEVQAIIKKFIKNANELIQSGGRWAMGSIRAQGEIDILEAYLPKQLSEAELTEAIKNIISHSEDTNMGSIMRELKEQFNSNYDGKLASTIVRAELV